MRRRAAFFFSMFLLACGPEVVAGAGTGGARSEDSNGDGTSLVPATTMDSEQSSSESGTSAGDREQGPRKGVWTGRYSSGFESMTFQLVEPDQHNCWIDHPPAEIASCCNSAFQVSGTLYLDGQYGHLDSYACRIEIDAVHVGPCNDGELADCGGFQTHCRQCTTCSPELQDCSNDERCVPVDHDGNGVWDDAECVPMLDVPVGPGEPCDSTHSDHGNCGYGQTCWDAGGGPSCTRMCDFRGDPLCEGTCVRCGTERDPSPIGLCFPCTEPNCPSC